MTDGTTTPDMEAPEPEVNAVEVMLRRQLHLFDWTKAETRAINDFILTTRYGIADDVESAKAHLVAAALGWRYEDEDGTWRTPRSGRFICLHENLVAHVASLIAEVEDGDPYSDHAAWCQSQNVSVEASVTHNSAPSPGSPPTPTTLSTPCPLCSHPLSAHDNDGNVPTRWCYDCGAKCSASINAMSAETLCPMRNGGVRLRNPLTGMLGKSIELEYPFSVAAPATIDSVLVKLEEAMHAHCDQPLSVDAMSLTRAWRAILNEFAATAQPAPPPESPLFNPITTEAP